MSIKQNKIYNFFTSLKLTVKGMASAFVTFVIFVCVIAVYEENYIKNRLPSLPEEKAFLAWRSQYTDKIDVYLNHPIHSKRRCIIKIEFKNMKLTDNDIKTYLVNLQVQTIYLSNVDITVQGVVLLLDNPYIDDIQYRNAKQGEIKEMPLNCLQEDRKYYQSMFLKEAENLEIDFVNLL